MTEQNHQADSRLLIMPRDWNATGLNFQAGLHFEFGGLHDLVAEVYSLERAVDLTKRFNAYPEIRRLFYEMKEYAKKHDGRISMECVAYAQLYRLLDIGNYKLEEPGQL